MNPLQERVVLLVQVRMDQLELLRFQLLAMVPEDRRTALNVFERAQRILLPGAKDNEHDPNAAAKAYLAREAQRVLIVRKQEGDVQSLRSLAATAAHPSARQAAQDQLNKMATVRARWSRNKEKSHEQ